MSFDLQARMNGGTVELFDGRSGQVLFTIHPTDGATVDGQTVSVLAGAIHHASGSPLSGSGTIASPLTLNVPTEDAHDSVTVWNDAGVLKVSTGA